MFYFDQILGDVKKLTFYLHQLKVLHREELSSIGLKLSMFESPMKAGYPKVKRKQPGVRTNNEEYFSSFQQESMICSLDSRQNNLTKNDADENYINCSFNIYILTEQNINNISLF